MKVPKEIRKIKRPPNTVVYAFGHDPVKYNVKERVYKVVDGKTIQKDGNTIGSIIDGKYVPQKKQLLIHYSDSDIRYWAQSKLVVELSKDILDALLKVYNTSDAIKTFVIAILRTIEEDLKDYEVKSSYDQDFISIKYPGVPLSKDSICTHIFDLGRTYSHIVEFMKLRTSAIPENHLIAIDGMLKSYESDKIAYSDYSRKALKKNSRDVSVVFAYDTESMEPVCSKVYSGNQTDVSVFHDFLKSNNVTRGLIVTDKGFSYNTARDVFDNNPNLHFLIPIKDSSKIITEYKALNFNRGLSNRYGIEGNIVKMQDGKYLYAFRDPEIAKVEEQQWVEEHQKFEPLELIESRKEFGTIVFVSDMDAKPEFIYAAYEERWELEVLFRYYKHILSMDNTRVKSEQSVIGTEFINFLSVIMMCRLRKKFLYCPLVCKMPFKKVMKILRKGLMIRQSPKGDWLPMKITSKEEEIFVSLGLLELPVVERHKRGRPKGSKNRQK